MSKINFSKITYLFVSIVLMLGIVLATPGGAVLADVSQVYGAMELGADRLTDLQQNDGGWDWPLDDGDPDDASAKNTVGPIAKGLAMAYWRTGDAEHKAALEDAGTLLLSKTAFSTSDGYLAAELDQVFGVTTYTDYVVANFYDKLADGTYDRNGTLYDTAAYVALIRQSRESGGIGNLAAWDLGMGLVAAAACGADTTAWVDGVKAEIDELDGGTVGAENDYDIIGLAGAIYGLAVVGEDFDTTAGDYAADASLAELADSLLAYQLGTGGFPDNKNKSVEDLQTTAYATMALNAVDRAAYLSDVQHTADYMIGIQMANGGWGESNENNEVTAEALWGIDAAYPALDEVWVCETGDCGHPGASFNVIQDGINNVRVGGIVHILDGSYAETLDIAKSVQIIGESRDDVIIDASVGGATEYAMDISADDVSLSTFTIQGGQHYGIKPAGVNNFSLQHVTIANMGRSGVDLNGVNGALIEDVQSTGTPYGVGIGITDSNGVQLIDITTADNAWGGIAIYTYGRYYPGGVDGVQLSGTNSLGEVNQLYVELENYGDPENPFPAVNLDFGPLVYEVHNNDNSNVHWYQETFESAKALIPFTPHPTTPNPDEGAIKYLTDDEFLVDPDLKIQAAVDAAVEGDTIRVAAGTYVEDVTIDKGLNLYGPNAGVNPNTDTREAEAVILLEVPGDTVDDTLMWYLEADNITIDGFTFDGDNPALTSGVDVRGADVDSGSGIVSYEGIGGVHIENNILQNFTYSAITMYNYYDNAATADNFIRYNWIDNLNPDSWGMGILVYNNFYVDIVENVITRGRVGIQTGNYHRANVGETGKIENNDIEVTRLGLFYNLMYSSSDPLPVRNNVFTALPHENSQSGMLITSIQNDTQTVFENNNITGFDYGINFWNDPTTSFVTVIGGVVDQCDYGVFANNYDGYKSNGNTQTVQFQNVTVQNSTTAAVYVKDNELNDNNATVHLNVLNGNTFTNNPVDFLIEGMDATMSLDDAYTHNFVWNIDNAQIQPALDETYAGDTFVVLAGSYEQNISIDKQLDFFGEGSGDDPAVDTILTTPAVFDNREGVIQLTGSGTLEQPLLIQDVRIDADGQAGISVGRMNESTGTSVSYVKLENVSVNGTNNTATTEQERGLYVDPTSSLDHLTVNNSAFSNLAYGWYFKKDVSEDASTVSNVMVSNTFFNHNDLKGIYAEKLTDASFDGITVVGNGYRPDDVPSYFLPWMSGVDINLKAGAYQNISFVDSIFADNALGGAKEGVALTVKARDDGSTYGAHPATLDNVQIISNTFDGNERGIRIGEPGKDNAGPTNVEIHFNRFVGNEQSYTGTDGSAYGGILNQSIADVNAENNWFGCNEGPGAAGCDAVGGTGLVDADPWLVLTVTPEDDTLEPGMDTNVEASLYMNSDDLSTAADGFLQDGLTVDFTTPLGGSVDPISDLTMDAVVETIFTSPITHTLYQVCAAVDNALVCTDIEVVGPGAVDDAYTTPEETTLNIAAPGVLANDTGIDTINHVVALVTEPTNGTVSLNADGSFSYTPDAGFVGEDSFVYQLTTYPGAKSEWVDDATVTITVTEVNKAPTAAADTYNGEQNVTMEVNAEEGILSNDSDPNGDALTITLVDDVLHGTLTLNADGSFTYVPEINYIGQDSFTYYVSDGELDSETVTVTLNLAPGIPITSGYTLFIPVVSNN